MAGDLARANATAAEAVLLRGDLDSLTPDQRTAYMLRVCESLNLNPLTKPFEFVRLSGRLVMYARKDCTEQLRRRDRVSVQIAARELVGGVYVVTARATLPDGRQDESIGAVPVEGLKGEALANAYMKAETKAKRRVTLSICGLGLLDESEVESVPGAVREPAPAAEPVRALPPGPPPPPAPPRPNGLPADGAELHRRLREYDAKLAAKRLCAAGALLAHVAREGRAAGHGEDIAAWSGPAIPFAAEVVKAFEAGLRRTAAESPPDREPGEDLEEGP